MPGDYTPQAARDLMFKFFPGSYSAPTFNNVPMQFGDAFVPTHSATASLNAAINVMGLYHTYTYTYVKYCPTYVVGYNAYGVQIIKGPCVYGGIRDLSAYIEASERWISTQRDLNSVIKGIVSSYKDLPTEIGGHLPEDITASIKGWDSGELDLSAYLKPLYIKDLSAYIDTHPPIDLEAYVNVVSRGYKDLPTTVYGWQASDLRGILNVLYGNDLPASVLPIPGVDLPAYLKAWPQRYLTAALRGWGKHDLQATVGIVYHKYLPATIGAHPWVDLGVWIKGWGREEPRNLQAIIGGLGYIDLPAIIRCTYLNNLIAAIYGVPPRNLSASIYGWVVSDLPAYLNVIAYPYDLRATIFGVDSIYNLPASIVGMAGTGLMRNLRAALFGVVGADLPAYIYGIPAYFLRASINPVGYSRNLNAEIYPKMIRLTGLLSISTMEHLDMAATINISCLHSMYKNLSAYIRCTHFSDLWATIRPINPALGVANLNTTVGYSDKILHIDKLPLTLDFTSYSYRNVDKLPIYTYIFNGQYGLSASIDGILNKVDLGATIVPYYLEPYNFDNTKHREKVYTIKKSVVQNFKIVELSFRSTVKEYFYADAADSVYKTDRLDDWKLDVKSYLPETPRLGLKRRLYRSLVLDDLTSFDSIDEAIKYAIDYTTNNPFRELNAFINIKGRTANLNATILPKYMKHSYIGLPTTIEGVEETSIIGLSGPGIEIV